MRNYCLRLSWRLVVIMAGGSSVLARANEPTSAVLYINRHFEVRDYDQAIKYVFNGDTRVAEISGSLSARNRLQRLRVHRGWNLISLAVAVDDLAAQLERNQAGAVESAYQWNPNTEDYTPVVSNQVVSAGTVLWIKALTNASFGIVGPYSDPAAAHVRAGGDYIAGTGLEAWSPMLPESSSGWTYGSDIGQWQENFNGSLEAVSDPALTITPGGALYFKADSDTDLPIPDPTLRIRYYHQDHLGSSSILTDDNGIPIEEIAFYPFGARRNEDLLRGVEEPYQFTQKEFNVENGLDYFEARYLAGTVGRFLSVDPKYAAFETLSAQELTSYLADPQKGDLYAYVQSSPLRLTDPTGMDSFWEQFRNRNAAPPPVQTRQKATFSDQPKRYLSDQTTWRANLAAVCQTKPGDSDYRVLDTITYGYDIDAGGNVRVANPVGGNKINVTSFNTYRGTDDKGKAMGGVTIRADYTGSCEYTLKWVQTVVTSNPVPGCHSVIFNDPCISDDPEGEWLPFYWTDKETPAHVQELDRTPDSAVHNTMRQWEAIFH